MKSLTCAALAAAIVTTMTLAKTATAADVSASLDLASAYVFRGATFNDGAVLQPGLKVGTGGFTIGAWGNLDIDDMGGDLESGEFSEIDLYGSYDIPVAVMDLSVSYTEYTYPNGGVADREVGLSIGKESVLLSPSLSLYYGVDGGIDKALYAEAGIGHAVKLLNEALTVSAGATVGYLAPDAGESGFSHFTTTLGVSYGMLSASVTYVETIDEDVLADAHDVTVYGILGISGDL